MSRRADVLFFRYLIRNTMAYSAKEPLEELGTTSFPCRQRLPHSSHFRHRQGSLLSSISKRISQEDSNAPREMQAERIKEM